MNADATHPDPAVQLTSEAAIETTAERRRAFVSEVVADAGADGVVVALSGGLDSTTAATLAVDALGREAVYGLVLPTAANDDDNMADAQCVAFDLGIDFRTVDLEPTLSRFEDAVTRAYWLGGSTSLGDAGPTHVDRPDRPDVTDPAYRAVRGNVAARLRMAATYFEANWRERLVLGTSNRTELLLGYVTKYGDGGSDLLPLGDLYKTEVRALARHLDVPERVVDKEPTAGLWDGQTDASELGAGYETVDAVLTHLVDERLDPAETADALGVDRETVERLADRWARTAHKRRTPPTPTTYP